MENQYPLLKALLLSKHSSQEVQTTYQFSLAKSASSKHNGADAATTHTSKQLDLLDSAVKTVSKHRVKTSCEYFIDRYFTIGDEIGVGSLERWVSECPTNKLKNN